MSRSITRIGDLHKVFRGGASPLLNRIARLAILFEDLRIEMAGIRGATGSMGVMDTLGEQHREIYFVRRSLITIVEMRKCLAAITGTDEYQARRLLLPEKHRASITEADRFLRRNEQLFQQLRNEFGGHIHEKWKTRQFQQWSAARSAR